MESRPTDIQPMRAKLIFNPSAGAARRSPIQIVDVIHEMQAWGLIPEVHLVEPGSDLPQVVQDALARGIRMFVACGGDGTVNAVARTLTGAPSHRATLGIIPIGTQNNTALSLGIPDDLPAAVAILRTGRRTKVDVGMAACPGSSSEGGETNTPFFEACSVGLASRLYQSADDVQHGDLARIGDFLATLVSSPPAEIRLLLDDEQEVRSQGHVVVVSNMPYIGLHYRVGTAASFEDGLLDVLFFADLSKLDLLAYVFQGVGTAKSEDPRIKHYRVRRVEIDTEPAMPIMVDGDPLGEGRVRIEVRPRVLAVMVGQSPPEGLSGRGETPEAETQSAEK